MKWLSNEFELVVCRIGCESTSNFDPDPDSDPDPRAESFALGVETDYSPELPQH
jgi:hypothetical protein